MFDDDIGKIISGLPESVNGIPISKFRLIAERYPCVSGVWIDMRVSGACVNPQGRIFLNPNIQSETVARFPLDGIEVDGEVTAWLTFFHECAHLCLGHIKNNALPSEILHAQRRMEKWSIQEKEIYASVVIKNQDEADRWAVSEYKQLRKEGLIMSNEVSEIQNKIANLKKEKEKIEAELLSTNQQLLESKEFQEQARLKQLESIEPAIEQTYKELLTHNWQTIPNFLNSTFQKLSEMCKQYDDLHKKNLELEGKFKGQRERYINLGGQFAPIHNKLFGQIEVIELEKELAHIMTLLTSDKKLFRDGMPTRFLNPIYSRAKKDF